MTVLKPGSHLFQLIAGTLVGILAAGCSAHADGCQSGAESAVKAVDELLRAAVDSDPDRACRVTTPLEADVLAGNLGEINQFVESVGGRSALFIHEDGDRQMGSDHLVIVGVADLVAQAEFHVFQEGDRYLVGVGESSPADGRDEETTEPRPRPTAEQSSSTPHSET